MRILEVSRNVRQPPIEAYFDDGNSSCPLRGHPFIGVCGPSPLLLITMAVSSAIIPFALTCWIILIASAKWTNVFAAIAIVSMGVVIGRVVGFRCGSRSNDR